MGVQYLSTDPNAGKPTAPPVKNGYLSTDPNAGDAAELSKMPAMRPIASHTSTSAQDEADMALAAAAGGGYSPMAAKEMGQTTVEGLQGAKAGAASTVFHGGDLIRRATGAERIIDRPDVKKLITPPNTAPGKVGFMGEQAAEFALPVSKVAKATEAAPLIARAAAEAAATAGVTGVQTGGDGRAMATSAALAAGGPLVLAGGRAAFGAARRVASGAAEGGVGGAVASATRSVAGVEPKVAMIQALKPRAANTGFSQALDRAMPEIKATEDQLGKPIASVQDLLDATKLAKKRVWSQYEQMAGPQRAMGATIDGAPIADAMARSIPSKLKLEDPRAAAALLDKADKYRRSFTIDEAEQLLTETNADLDSFYAQYPGAQRRALLSNPEAARLNGQADALRTAIYKKLDGSGEGAAARELKRRYGALMDVEQEATRRVNVAARQQPESLAEQIANANGLADRAAGAFRVGRGILTASPSDVIAGGADMVRGQVRRQVAKFIKDQQTSDALVRRAFASYGRRPIPVPMPMRRPVAGLLNRGAIPMPPVSDESFARGVPARPTGQGGAYSSDAQ